MSDGKVIHVSIGEVKIGRGDDVLLASLGSCVGIALLWKSRGLYGLAHCLLPEAPAQTSRISGRFVTEAVPSLLALMKLRPENHAEIEAVLVGGGNMTAPKDADPDQLVGAMNARVAQDCLERCGIRIVHREVGGMVGRKIRVYCERGEYAVEAIPRISKRAA